MNEGDFNAQGFFINGLATTVLSLFGIGGYVFLICIRRRTSRCVLWRTRSSIRTLLCRIARRLSAAQSRFEQYLLCIGVADVAVLLSAMAMYGFISLVYNTFPTHGPVAFVYLV